MKKHEIVVEYIIRSVQTGNLHLGDLLPSIRTLAKDLGISTSTVFEAYCRLERLGLITGEERIGFSLTDISDVPALRTATKHFAPPVSETQINHHFSTDKSPKEMIPFGSISPQNKYFPSEDISKCLSRVVRSHPRAVNNYGFNPHYSDELPIIEQSTARYMYKVLGITVSEEEICHANGATEGLQLALRTVTKRGDRIVVESPGFLALYNMLWRMGLEKIEVESLPPNGLNIDHLEQILATGLSPTCIVVTPNFQNPAGSLMPLENRQRLLDLCIKHNIVMIEDDVMGALRFGDRIPSLKEMMPEDVIYVSSYSKVMAPGYRVGWIAGGKYNYNIKIVQRLESFAMTRSLHFAIAQYIDSGKCKAYLSNLRKVYEKNCNLMSEALEKSFPKGTIVHRPRGGQYLWVEMLKNTSAGALTFKAQSHNILLAPGGLYNGLDKYNNCLRFCFALEMTQEIYDAIELVGKLALEAKDE